MSSSSIFLRARLSLSHHFYFSPRTSDPCFKEPLHDFILSPLPLSRSLFSSLAEAVKVDGPKRGKSKKKPKKKDIWNATQKCKSLQEVLDEEEYHKYPSWVPNYASIAAAPSRYPPRRFCSVSGLEGKYKCPVTGDYLATMDAYTTHRETRLKGLI